MHELRESLSGIMNIADILSPDRARLAAEVRSKKRALEQLADILADGTPYLTAADVFNGLIGRERLGGTGVGDGVAIPHARIKGIDDCVGGFMRLPLGVNFESTDEQPVDLIFGLLVPETATDEHLKLLRRLAEIFSDAETRVDLRAAADDHDLYRALLDHDTVPG